jgi:hypothetical protein
VNPEIRSVPDWMLLTLPLLRLNGRRLRIYLGEETFYDTTLQVPGTTALAHRIQPDSPYEACCVKVMLNAMVYYLSGHAVSQIRETDESCLGTDLVLILPA